MCTVGGNASFVFLSIALRDVALKRQIVFIINHVGACRDACTCSDIGPQRSARESSAGITASTLKNIHVDTTENEM